MRLPPRITREWLDQNGACEGQANLFEETWPEGVLVTQKSLALSAKAGLSLAWFAEQILSPFAYTDYLTEDTPLYAACHAKSVLLYNEYEAERVLLVTSCKQLEATMPLWETDYRAKRDILHAAYTAKRTALYAEYEPKRDALLIAALWGVYEKEAGHYEA